MTPGPIAQCRALAFLIVTALVCSAGTAGAQETLQIRGQLTYKTKSALPADSTAVIEVRDSATPQGPVIAETRIPLQGKSVPVPFTIAVDRGKLAGGQRYSLTSSIVSGGKASWSAKTVAINAAAPSLDVGTISLKQGHNEGGTASAASYRCGDQQVSVSPVAGGIVLVVDGRSYDMQPVQASSGSKFAVPGDPSTWFWEKAHGADLTLHGRYSPPCGKSSSKTAALRVWGVDPAWTLDLGDPTLHFLADGNATRLDAPMPLMVPEGNVRRYTVQQGGHSLTVRISDRICKVAAYALPQPTDVAVTYDSRQLHGCGGDPASVLMGRAWLITTIDGTRPAASDVTIKFEAEGRLTGMTGCNTLVGRYAISASGLAITGLSTTLKVCDGALAQQEKLLLAALAAVQGFDIPADGNLLLKGKENHAVSGRR